jgi:hypothetical protein
MSTATKHMPIGRLIQVQDLMPPLPNETHEFVAGNLTFGFERRDVESDNIPAAWEAAKGAVFKDGGQTIHVWDTNTRAEYLRFDCFRIDPHYHYNWPEKREYLVVPYDMFAHGDDMLAWTFRTLRERLASLLKNTGGAPIITHIDHKAVTNALDAMERLANAPLPTPRARA